MEMSADDIRLLREIKAWYQSNKYTAQLPAQQVRRQSQIIGEKNWVVVNVVNNCGYNRTKWSAGIIEGLVDPSDYNDNTALYPPTDLTARRFNWTECDLTSVGGLHAVLLQDLNAGASGKAVIRGVVPGKISGISSTSEYTPQFITPPQSTAANLTSATTWISTLQSGVGGYPAHSKVVYAWDATSEQSWGLIDLNSGTRYNQFFTWVGSNGADLGVTYGAITLSNGSKVSVYSFDGTPIAADEDPLAFVTGVSGSTQPSIAFTRHCNGICRWTAHIEPGLWTGGSASTAVTNIYRAKKQAFRFYVRRWTDISGTPAAGSETLIAEHEIGEHLNAADANINIGKFTISGMFFFSTHNGSTQPDSELPTAIEIRCQWDAGAGGTVSSSAEIYDFSTEWEIIQVGARAGEAAGIDWDGAVREGPVWVP